MFMEKMDKHVLVKRLRNIKEMFQTKGCLEHLFVRKKCVMLCQRVYHGE